MSFYVTTPIYYVNAAPHLGHAYSTIAADVLARHMRQRGEDVFFLTGTDEHGEPVALAAESEGVTPQELVDRNAPRFQELAPRLNVSNDFFIRTTDPEHKAKVQEVLTRIRDNGHVYEGVYEGWYCPRCADFKTDAEAGEDNLCPIHRIALTREKEDNYFFRLSAFQDDLLRLLDEQPDFVMPRHRYNEARSFIESGLQDVSLSRSTLTWGVPVPWDPEHVFYVWFDALLNYYTALSYAKPGEDLTERFWPAQYHVIGKDILKFHTVFWPAMLLAAGLPLPEHVFVHGFLLMGSRPPTARRPSSEDEQVAGQRARPVRDHRRVRRRRAALLLHARRQLRPGRRGLHRALRRALRVRAGQRLRQPRQPHDRDGPPLPRRRRCPPASPIPRSRPRSTRSSTEVSRAARPRGPHRRAGRDLAARAPPEPLRRGAGAVGARQGRGARRRARPRARVADRGPARRRASCCTRGSPRASASCSTRSARPSSSSTARAMQAGRLGAIAKLEPLFPKP